MQILGHNQVNRSNLIKLLMEKPIKITFVKKTTEGTRVMICTLMGKEIPVNYHKSLEKVFMVNPRDPMADLLPVWDLIKGAWRSFYISHILSVEDVKSKEDPKTSKIKGMRAGNLKRGKGGRFESTIQGQMNKLTDSEISDMFYP